jgi:hypothetical protein
MFDASPLALALHHALHTCHGRLLRASDAWLQLGATTLIALFVEPLTLNSYGWRLVCAQQ